MRRSNQLKVATILVAAIGTVLGTVGAAAAESGNDPGFLRTERAVTGSSLSASWHDADFATARAFDQIGGDGLDADQPEVGAVAAPVDEPERQGPSRTGEKVKAGALSLVLPGAGQFYNGDRTKAYVMFGIEVGIWVTYFVFDNQGDNSMESSRSYASIYAGTSGEHDDAYWRAVGQHMDSDAYNEAVLREQRATGTVSGSLVGPDAAWQWVNEQRRKDYQGLRADAIDDYDRRDLMILFAVINRTVSVVDAVMGAGKQPGVIDADVMGVNVGFGVLPSWEDPGARLTVTRGF